MANDANITVNLSILPDDEALNGCKKTLSYSALFYCDICEGWGTTDKTPPQMCQICKGKGKTERGIFTKKVKQCEKCKGLGRVMANPCGHCGGAGMVQKELSVDIDIPPNVHNFQILQINGKGSGTYNKERGDLFVVINVNDNAQQQMELGDVFQHLFNSDSSARNPQTNPIKKISQKINKKEDEQLLTKNIKYIQLQKCDICEGKGGKIATPVVFCPMCNGKGFLRTKTQNKTIFGTFPAENSIICGKCFGHGHHIENFT